MNAVVQASSRRDRLDALSRIADDRIFEAGGGPGARFEKRDVPAGTTLNSDNRRFTQRKGCSMQKITPFIWLDGTTDEAMTTYASLFRDGEVIGRYR